MEVPPELQSPSWYLLSMLSYQGTKCENAVFRLSLLLNTLLGLSPTWYIHMSLGRKKLPEIRGLSYKQNLGSCVLNLVPMANGRDRKAAPLLICKFMGNKSIRCNQ